MKYDAFERGISKAIRLGVWFSFGATVLMTLLLSFDVLGRTFLNKILPGTVELVELLMVITVFMTLAYASLEGAHVTVDLVYSKLPKRIQTTLSSLTNLLGVIIFALFSWEIGSRAWQEYRTITPLESTMLHVPFFPFLFVAAFGSLLFCMHLIVLFFRSVHK